MQPFAWNDFYTSTKNRPPWPRLVRAVELLKCGGEALDLGCGAGRDTRYLLASGFRVTAVDQESVSLELLADLPPDRLHRVQSPFEDFQFGYYDLINAHFALPFIGREQFPLVFARLKDALKPGAIFVGQFFGRNDSWNTPETHMTFFTRQQALVYLDGLELLEFEEEDQDGPTAVGKPKHWHVYHIIARKA
ncbi:SAM-dependent methyltransferase [Ktedonobacter sp. SOSP1-52]|uniref:class I SAM-dependent methyltransferase n=1 Tax=Ktedonobacter sp. SOSP1-52 TaxID=2778366 RepID=UPI001916426A|nr:class I SAM-dependent methyltransferase [Ktedonobacter sp. SOSP1-52]GHO65084.1 SAM-dependent methyltransferase [Ktedonobacter sp. SOSP1-52]